MTGKEEQLVQEELARKEEKLARGQAEQAAHEEVGSLE